MRRFLLSFALALSTSAAMAAPASEASINELLTASRAESLMESMYGHIEALVRQGLEQKLNGQTLNDEQKRVVAQAPGRIAAMMRQEFSWKSMQPMYVSIYREAFTDEEIQGLTRFYQTPDGQALLNKMPLVMKRSMELMQVQMQVVLPKVEAMMKELAREAKLPIGA